MRGDRDRHPGLALSGRSKIQVQQLTATIDLPLPPEIAAELGASEVQVGLSVTLTVCWPVCSSQC